MGPWSSGYEEISKHCSHSAEIESSNLSGPSLFKIYIAVYNQFFLQRFLYYFIFSGHMQKELKISITSLIIANILTIIFALTYNLDLKTIIIIYWFQSIIIGIFQFIKIKNLEKFSTKNFLINGHPVMPTEYTKNNVLLFFPFHYGAFHFIYFIFLGLAFIKSFSVIILPISIFLINHLISYITHKNVSKEKIPNIGTMLFLPYLRIVPMHLILILFVHYSYSISTLLVVFLILRTIADLVMHIFEHKILG